MPAEESGRHRVEIVESGTSSSSGSTRSESSEESARHHRRKHRHELHDRSDIFLVVCRCFSAATIIGALLCAVANVIFAVYSFQNQQNVFSSIFCSYGVGISLFVAAAEVEWDIMILYCKILNFWFIRGILQIFVAVMTESFANADLLSEIEVVVYQLGSYSLITCGLIYIIAGLLCLGHWKQVRLRRKDWHSTIESDIEDLERHKKSTIIA